jgi:DNA helicase HerA-like ATPase
VDADALIAERQILIVNLASGSPGDDVSVLLGSFLVQKIIAAAFRQARLPERDRVPHVLVVDEFQRFMHESASFDQILAEARKYRLRLLVANQFAEQLDPGVRAALFGNVGTLAAFRLGHRDARLLAAEFPGAHVEDLMELGRGQCLVRIGTDWTTLRTLPPPLRPEDDPMPRIVAATFDCIRAFAEQSAHPKPAPDETEEEFVC